ncbi:MAG: class I SAM-dependent methyltransferase [Rhizobiaceae bacterium]
MPSYSIASKFNLRARTMNSGAQMANWQKAGIGIPFYRAIAANYDRLHARFLRMAGSGGQSAFEGAVLALINPGMDVLDAACGTGAFASRLTAQTGAGIRLTLLDGCPEMLRQAPENVSARILGHLENLPFAACSFDIVCCSWGIETTEQPARTIRELMRVVRPGGHLCFVACADVRSPGFGGRIIKRAMLLRQTGRFLEPIILEEFAREPENEFARSIPCRGPAVAMVVKKAACPQA